MARYLGRRKFLATLGGAAAAWPLAARAQQRERVRRIGVLMNTASDDPQSLQRIAAFLQGLQELGWTVGRNVQIDTRWRVGVGPERLRKDAAELVALARDVIVCPSAPITTALQQVTRIVPIVFAGVIDPVGAGLVESLAEPGGNATGFTLFEYGLSVKWLELLKEIAPDVKRAAVLRDPATATGIGQLAVIQAVAPSLGMEVVPARVGDASEIERAITALARRPNSGLIVGASSTGMAQRDLIITLAAGHKVPAVYWERFFVTGGGLMSYGPGSTDPFRRAASYVDRILKGEKPADLPVQNPTKYELVINLTTAKALGLDVPATLLARADEVIE